MGEGEQGRGVKETGRGQEQLGWQQWGCRAAIQKLGELASEKRVRHILRANMKHPPVLVPGVLEAGAGGLQSATRNKTDEIWGDS